jgi:hypothetical protein
MGHHSHFIDWQSAATSTFRFGFHLVVSQCDMIQFINAIANIPPPLSGVDSSKQSARVVLNSSDDNAREIPGRSRQRQGTRRSTTPRRCRHPPTPPGAIPNPLSQTDRKAQTPSTVLTRSDISQTETHLRQPSLRWNRQINSHHDIERDDWDGLAVS